MWCVACGVACGEWYLVCSHLSWHLVSYLVWHVVRGICMAYGKACGMASSGWQVARYMMHGI